VQTFRSFFAMAALVEADTPAAVVAAPSTQTLLHRNLAYAMCFMVNSHVIQATRDEHNRSTFLFKSFRDRDVKEDKDGAVALPSFTDTFEEIVSFCRYSKSPPSSTTTW
jgi:hypothetical protein